MTNSNDKTDRNPAYDGPMGVFDDFGPVISAYSTDQAIEDGLLVHFDAITPGKWCVTNGVMAAIEDKSRGQTRTPVQALANLMRDTLGFMQLDANRRTAGKEIQSGGSPLFCDDFARHMEGNITGQNLWMGMNETGGFTVMFPEER